jgi:cell division cycle 20-like protein 1 (cofactor of APC complex)
MQDDFYLNLLEWSSQNILSVALESSLYFWNGNNNRVVRFCDIQPSLISSVTWNEGGTHIAVGSSQGVVDIWDVGKTRKLKRI